MHRNLFPARALRRGLIASTLIVGVALFAGPSMATHGGGHLTINDVTVTEGNSGAQAASFTVALDAAPGTGETVTVNYATADGTAAVLDGDYLAAAGILTFNEGETTKPVNVTVNGDTIDEIDETFTLTLSTPSPGTEISDATGVGTIDDDDGPNITIGDVTVVEGAGNATFTVSLSPTSSPQDVSVDYTTANGTAAAGSDYTATSGTLTIPSGMTSGTLTVPIIDDGADENDETFVVNLSGAVDGTITDSQGVGTITDNDDPPSISINDVSVTEGNSGSVNATFTVSLSAASGKTVTVNYATQNDTATAGSDYTAVSSTQLQFDPSQTSKTVNVAVLGDTVDEPDETFFVNLSGASNATIADGQGVGTILDNDGPPSLSINDVSVTEGNSGTVNANFTVTLAPSSGQTVTVNFATADGTATAPADYTSTSGTLTFSPGQTTKTVTVVVKGDTLNEPNEAFFVDLSGATNATIGDSQGVGTILDDDPAPSISINDVTVTEGNSGTVNAVFTVTLSSASGSTVTVNHATANGTATAPADYQAIPTTQLQFNPGETSKTITVLVNGDVADETNETFFVNLSGASNATISDNQGVGNITDDDGPTISINDVTVLESAGNAVFTVQLSAQSPQTITVQFATANGSASSPQDYGGTGGTLTFTPTETAKTISVAIVNDSMDEVNETFFVNLSSSTNASIADAQGQATITDDDGPSITVNNVSPSESAGNATFTVTLSSQSLQSITVQYATANGTAAAGSDYTATNGTLTIPAGQSSGTVQVPIANDTLDENDETFFLNLSNATNATIADTQGQATILDDDPNPTLSINSISQNETNSGATNFVFTVTLSAVSGRQVTVNYATQNGTAVAPGDYQATSGTLTFIAGDVSEQITVLVSGDTLNEANETFTVNLSSPQFATIPSGQGAGTGTILNDDGQPSLSINDLAVNEAAGTAVLTVTLAPASGQTVTVNYATSDGPAPNATAPADYQFASGTLTFGPGPPAETTKQITIPIASDTIDEENEKFTVTLSNAVNAAISKAQGVVTINDDDAPPNLSISDASVLETNTGATANAVFTLQLSTPSGKPVVVTYSTANVTAVAPGDYTAATNQTVTFNPGETTKTISVVVVGDALDEPDETFTVNISAPNANVTDGQGVGTIVDNDPSPSLTISDATVAPAPGKLGEGDSGQGACTTPFSQCAVFTVTLSSASGQTVTVSFATSDGTATTADYASTGGALVFSPGQTSKTVLVPIKGDTVDEFNETFFVNLSAPTNATIADGQGVGTIVDDDGPPALSVTGASDSESSTEGAVVVVALAPASGQQVSVTYSTADGSAKAGNDYVGVPPTTLVFTPGQTSKAVSIQLLNDQLDEDNETFTVNLSNPQNAIIKNDPITGRFEGTGVVTITDDDPMPTVSIGDVTVTEGNAGTVSAIFPLTLSAPSGRTVGVTYSTADGSAVAPEDYAAASGTVSFAAGETTKTVVVAVIGDGAVEADETFFVNLSAPTNATIADGQGVGTITNDDAAVVVPPPPTDSTTSTTTTDTTTPTSTTTTTTTSRPPTPTQTLKGMRVSSAPVVLIDNLAPIGITCSKTAKGTCLGTVVVQGQARSLAVVNGRPVAKAITLGRESYAIQRGRTEKVLVSLNKRAVKALKRAGKLRVTVVVTARDSAGKRAKPIKRALWLKVAKKAKKAKKKPQGRARP